jgi:O-antigen ligase
MVISIILLLGLIYFLFLTGTRTTIFAVIFSLLFYFLFFTNPYVRLRLLLINIFGLFVVFLLFVNQFLPSEILDRFTFQELFESGFGNRLEIWEELIDLAKERSLLFGLGFIMDSPIIPGSHNILIHLFVQFGLIGFIIYSSIIFKLLLFLFYKIKLNNNLVYSVITFVFLLFNGIGEDIFYFLPFWFVIGFSLFLVKNQTTFNMKSQLIL